LYFFCVVFGDFAGVCDGCSREEEHRYRDADDSSHFVERRQKPTGDVRKAFHYENAKPSQYQRCVKQLHEWVGPPATIIDDVLRASSHEARTDAKDHFS
jgi:hypothetical protein